MSYRCDECGAQAPRGQQVIKRGEYRKKSYHNRTYNEKKRITTGTELICEKKLCKKCAEKGDFNASRDDKNTGGDLHQ